MRYTIGIAVGICALTAVFLAIVVQRRPIPRTVVPFEPPPVRKPAKKAPKAEKGVVKVWLKEGARLHTARTRVEAVSATDPSARFAQDVTGGVCELKNLAHGEWYVSASTAALVAPVRIVVAGDKPANAELALAPAAKVRGSVFDAEGKPLREAHVVARELLGAHGSGAPREALTSSEGTFEFAFLAAGRYELVASAEAWEPSSRQVTTKAGELLETQDTIFRLAPVKWGTIRGAVMDSDGRPVPSATLRVQPDVCRILTVPGADGVFVIEAPPGRVVLAVDAPGLAMEIRDDIVVEKGSEQNVEIRLGQGVGVVEGRVLLGSGEPAAGARVECAQGSGEPGEATGGPVATTTTDAQGRFLMRGFAEGIDLLLRVTAEGQPSLSVGPFRVPVTDCEIVIGEVRHAVLEGRVVTAEPMPAGTSWQLKLWRVGDTGARRIVGTYDPGVTPSPGDPLFESGEDGKFSFQRLMPGTYALGVSAQGFAPTEVGPVFLPAESRYSGVTLRLGRGRSVSGRVVGTTSRAKIAGAGVTVLNAAGEAVAPEVLTDDEGAFTVPNLGPGRYTLVFRHDAYREARKEVTVVAEADSTGVTASMDDSPTLTGKVIDGEGKPVDGGTVIAMREGERREGAITNGTYEIRGLSGGLYTLWATSPGRGLARRPGVSVSADGRTIEDVRLSPGGTLRITLRAGESPVVGAKVALRWKDGSEISALSLLDGAGQLADATDAHGVLVLLNVPAEPLVLRVTKGGTTREIDVCVLEGATLEIPVAWAE